MIPRLLQAGRPKVLSLTFTALLMATALDWAAGVHMSLAPVYIIPMMIGAVVLRKAETAGLAVVCALLRARFDVPGPPADLVLRFIFATAAYWVSALFVSALVHNHQLALEHVERLRIERDRRRDVEEQLRVLVESSPAAIFLLDSSGVILSANNAARRLLAIQEETALQGENICAYLPFFAGALDLKTENLGTAVKCQGERADGERFSADVWFSSYCSASARRLAAIVADSSEEMRDREEQGLLNIKTGNQIATAAIAHEVRNFCQAITMLCDDLGRRHHLAQDEAWRGLDRLVSGLGRIASLELRSREKENVAPIDLKDVLDNLRIVIEPEWREIGGAIQWRLPVDLPLVTAEPHGLLQAFLNLAQNSHRAVRVSAQKTLKITATNAVEKVVIRFEDSGPGIQRPEALFRPFHDSAFGSGLGLYVSRFIVRGYGGELRFEPNAPGASFVIELDAVHS